ncbi:hypothetical protein DPEC_G00214460 [Dallia pectoralis]|uniref:Uncharacterized protein n=1 Tax=Dallia pectoralis TaxID=75939 RepID=A0ACC2G200_DALPE|nr:hypothetical protein DPEC_G00214460 [Dallia pectoralis]
MLVLLLRLACFSLWSTDVFSRIQDEKKNDSFPFKQHALYDGNVVRTGVPQRWHSTYRRVMNPMDNKSNGTSRPSSWDAIRTWVVNTHAKRGHGTTALKGKFSNASQTAGFPQDGETLWRTKRKLAPTKQSVVQTRFSRRKRGSVVRLGRDGNSGRGKYTNIINATPVSHASLDSPVSVWEPLPKPMAQNRTTDGPYGDYEVFTFPHLQNYSSFVPLNPKKDVQNPFYPVTADSYGAYAILIISVIIFIFGILGNIAVMCIVCHNYYMRSISNSLLANLALWDFVVIFFCQPLVIFHELTNHWLLGEFSCKIIPYIEVTSFGVTTFTLCALCIDRLRAATNVQMYYEMVENCASTGAKLAVIWIGALLLALPELLIRQLVTEDNETPTVLPLQRCVVRISTELPDTLYVLGLTYDGARLWWYFGCYFCLPTLFTIGSSLVTAHKIRRAERASVRGNKKQIQLESQMNCAVVALAILYGFCVIPENICNIITVYMATAVPRRTLDILQLVSQLLLFCKSAVTPVLLFCLCQPFSRALLDCCCCCCEECGPPRSSATSSEENEDERPTTDLELSPLSTVHREASVGTHC